MLIIKFSFYCFVNILLIFFQNKKQVSEDEFNSNAGCEEQSKGNFIEIEDLNKPMPVSQKRL